ncbi:MAG: NSS family neurotransmitter:Na+ symporter [Gammaproteobacteria bacterium]
MCEKLIPQNIAGNHLLRRFMAIPRESIHGQWSSRWVFILAATGSAVGLGNIWRFPYITGENGGGAFVLIYFVCVIAVGLPIMIGETVIGRRGRQSPINSLKAIAADQGFSANWQFLGWLGMLAGFLILSFYSVVAGWSVAYIFSVGAGTFADATSQVSADEFKALTDSAPRLLWWHSLFMLMTVFIVARGVQGGLEQAVKWLMPALFLLLFGMVFYAMNVGDFGAALSYLFRPDFSQVTADTVLLALGQAFFSLSLGMGSIIVYGSYLPADTSIPRTIGLVALCDTGVAVLAGLAIFPLVFGFNLEPGSGPGLVFVTLTTAFGQMPGGQLVGALFFVLLAVAGWTSAISILEPMVAWLVEALHWSRHKASAIAGGAVWFLGVGSVLSFNYWAEFEPLGRNFFGWSEFLSTSVMLPTGGLLVAVFAGWRMSRASTLAELGLRDGVIYGAWRFLARFIAPLGVFVVFLNALDLV